MEDIGNTKKDNRFIIGVIVIAIIVIAINLFNAFIN